jgi:hypothetical protein
MMDSKDEKQAALCYTCRHQFLELDPVEDVLVGKDPRKLSPAELAAMGHVPRRLLKAIRAKCIDCSGGSRAEVRKCTALACPLWQFRMGTNPYHRRKPSETASGRPFAADDGS